MARSAGLHLLLNVRFQNISLSTTQSQNGKANSSSSSSSKAAAAKCICPSAQLLSCRRLPLKMPGASVRMSHFFNHLAALAGGPLQFFFSNDHQPQGVESQSSRVDASSSSCMPFVFYHFLLIFGSKNTPGQSSRPPLRTLARFFSRTLEPLPPRHGLPRLIVKCSKNHAECIACI